MGKVINLQDDPLITVEICYDDEGWYGEKINHETGEVWLTVESWPHALSCENVVHKDSTKWERF